MSKNNGLDKKQQLLFSQAEINEMLESAPSKIRNYIDSLQNQISNMSAIGLALSKERDMEKLLEMILLEAKRISNADGGTLYMMTDDQRLRFSIMITDSLNVHMGGTSGKEIPFYPVKLYNDDGKPNENMIAANAAINGNTIRSYLRHQNPEIWVDGFPLHDPFLGREADESVDPAKIDAEAGTGVMAYIESDINTNMGLSIKRKAYGFTQKGHDSYLVDDWTFTNTGNADFDDNIEYPTQTLEDVYFFRQARGSEAEDFNQNWASSYGEYTTDTLRIQTYAYGTNIEGESFDQFGHKIEETGEIKEPTFRAEAALHIDTSADDPTYDPSQP